MSNRIKVTKGVQRRSAVEQALLIRDDVLAVVASANSRVPVLRQVNDDSAIEVVWRALNETRHLTSFAVRRNYAFSELKSFINLSQGTVTFSAVKKYSDLLPTAHPFSAAPHAMTASALADAQMQWYLADHRVTEETAPLLASAFSADSSDEQRKYAVTRLNATPEGATALEAITAAFSGDGNSYWARRMRAMRQRRDRLGRFAEEGGGMRALVRTADGSVRWLTGRTVGADPNSNTFDVETPRGIVRVPANSAEGIQAYLPGKEDENGYSPVPARITAADESDILDEADLQMVDAPAGWEPVPSYRGAQGDKAYTDGVYTVVTNENPANGFKLLDENGTQVGSGENWTDMLDQSLTDAFGDEERPTALPEDMLLDGLDEIANNDTAGSFQDMAKKIADFLRDGTVPSDRTAEKLAEQSKKIANYLALDKEEKNPNKKFFDKKFEGFEDDFRLGSEAILKKLQGQQVAEDKQEEQKPVAQLPETPAPAPASDNVITNAVPQGAYGVDTGEYLPEGRIDEESTDYTDDPAVLARMFDKKEIAKALQDAILGTNKNEVNGSGSGALEFDAGAEYVPAEALYHALKKQGVKADKFVNGTYKNGQDRLDKKAEEPIAEVPSEPAQPIQAKKKEDVADALDRVKSVPEVSEVLPAKGEKPIEDVNTAEEDAQEEDPNYPARIAGLTEDELQAWADSGFDHVPFLPKNEDIKLPEDYTQISPEPVALDEITTVQEGDALNQEGVPVGWTDDAYVLAQDFETQDLIDSLEFALEPRAEDSEYSAGKAPFSYTDENGDEFVMEISPEAIRDALQLQGEDTNEILQEIADRAWAAQADNKPVASDVEEGRSSADLTDEEMQAMMDGEGISEEPSVSEGIAEKIQGIKPGGGLTIDPLDGSEPTEGFVVARQGYNREINYDDFMANPGEYIDQYIEDNLDALSEEGNHLGFWHDEDNNEMVLDVAEVIGNREDAIQAGIDRNQQAIYDIAGNEVIETGGTGDRAETTENQPSESPEVSQGDDAGRAQGVGNEPGREVGTEEEEEVAPTSTLDKYIEGMEAPAEPAEPIMSEDAIPTPSSPAVVQVMELPTRDMQPGDVTIGDNFTITEIGTEVNPEGRVIVKGYFPGHPVQEKQWKPGTNIKFMRGIAKADMPLAGDLPELHKPSFRGMAGGPNNQDYKLAYAKWRGALNAALARWTNRPAAGSVDFDPSTDVHRTKVHANELKPGDVMADPTKGHFVIASVTEPDPNNPEHANAIAEDMVIVRGYYPGHEIQEKQWKRRQVGRNGREYPMDVVRNGVVPESGPLPEFNQGEVIDGVYVRNTDPTFVKQYNQKIAQAASRYDLPADAPEVSYPQTPNPALRAVERPVPARKPRRPREPADPMVQGAFGDILAEAEGDPAKLKELLNGKELIFFDFETTGLDFQNDNIWQIGAVKVVNGQVVDRFNVYSNPEKALDPKVVEKLNQVDPDGNPLTDEYLQSQVSRAEAMQQFLDFAGDNPLLVGQNTKFDRTFLERIIGEDSVDMTPAGYFDNQAVARALHGAMPANERPKNLDGKDSNSLGDLARHYGIDITHHDAASDSEATFGVLYKMLDKMAETGYGVDALNIDKVVDDQIAAERQYNNVDLPNYKQDMALWTASQAVEQGLANEPVNVDQVIQAAQDVTPELTSDNAEDVAGTSAPSTIPTEPARLATPEWIMDDANTRPIDRQDVRANSIQVGDFMNSADGTRWFQVTGVSEVKDNKFAITRVDVESNREYTTRPYWGNTRLDGIRRPINPDSLKTGDNGDQNLTQETKPEANPATMIEHVVDGVNDFTAETVIKDAGDGTLVADTQVFDNEGDIVDEKSASVSSIDDAQTFGDNALRDLHEEILALTQELASQIEEPTVQELPAEVEDVRFPTAVSKTVVTDSQGLAHELSIIRIPNRYGGGFELGIFKDDGQGGWEEADAPNNFSRYDTIEEVTSARDDVQFALNPTPKAPQKPARSKAAKQEAQRAQIQDGAYIVYAVVDGEGDYVWQNPDGSTTPIDLTDPEQSGDLSIGRVFGQPNTRVVEGGEAVRDALSNTDVVDTAEEGEEALDEPAVFAPGTPMIGDRPVRPHGKIDQATVVDPEGREFNVELQAASTLEGDPERYNVIIRDPSRSNIELAHQVASSREEADLIYADLKRGIAEGRVVYEANPNYGRDIASAEPGDSSPYITSELLPDEPPFRARVIGNAEWQKYSAEHFLYGDGQNQARLGDRVVHSYDGWNTGRGEGTIMHWEVIANPGDKARVGYAYVAFDNGSWGIYATDFLFLNGRGNDVNDERFAPPVSDEAKELERPKTNLERGIEEPRKFETTEKYTVETRKIVGGRGRTYTKIVPYVSRRGGTGLSKGVAETRRAYQMWLDRRERVAQYRERSGLPELSTRIVELSNPRDRVLGPIWTRATGLGGMTNAPQAPTPTPTPTPAPSAPEAPEAPEAPSVSAINQVADSMQSALDAAGISGTVSVENGEIKVTAEGDTYILSESNGSFTIDRYDDRRTPPRRTMFRDNTQEEAISTLIDMFGGPTDNGNGNGGGETPPETPPTAPEAPTLEVPTSQAEALQQLQDANLQSPGTYVKNDMSTVDENLKGVYWAKEGYTNSSSARAVAITVTPEGKFKTSAWETSQRMHRGDNPNYSDEFNTLNEAAAQANVYLAGRGIDPTDLTDSGPAGSNPQVLPGNPITEAPVDYSFYNDIGSYPSRLSQIPGARQNVAATVSYSNRQEVNMSDRVIGTQGKISYDRVTKKYSATVGGEELPNKFDTVDEAGDAVMQKFLEKRDSMEIPRSTGGTASRPYPLQPREKRLNAREVANLKSAIEEKLAPLNASTPVQVSIMSDDNSFTGLSYKIEVPSVEHTMILTQDTVGGGWTLSSLNSDGTIKSTGNYRKTSDAVDRINYSSRSAFDNYHMARVQTQRNRMADLQQELKDYDSASRASASVDSAGPEGTWNFGFVHKPAGYTNGYKVDVNINPDGDNTATVSVVSPDGTFDTHEIPANADLNTVLEGVKAKVDELATANKEESLAVKRARMEAKAGEVLESELALGLPQNSVPLYRRFLDRAMGKMLPVQQIEFDGSMQGVSNPNFDRVDANPVLTPNGDPVTQKHFQDQGWEAEKAAQIAHAGTSRPSIKHIAEITRGIRSGQYSSQDLNKAVGLGMGAGNQFGPDLKITSVNASGYIPESGSGSMSVSVNIKSTETGKSYSALRTFSFENGRLTSVYNANMFIEGTKSSGFSSLFNQYAENWYIANGADSITVSAAAGGFSSRGGATGGYVWAITGFNWRETNRAYDQLKARHDYLSRGFADDRRGYAGGEIGHARAVADMERMVQQAFDAYGVSSWVALSDAMYASNAPLAPTFPTPREMAMIGWTPELRVSGQHWFGKAFSMDNGFGGKKTLKPTSVERVQNYSYEAMKKATDKLVARGENSFENNESIKNHFASRDTYNGAGEVLAPYADELVQLTGYEGKRSVSQLSPPAKAALGKYLATVLADDSNPVFTSEDSATGEAINASIKADFVSMLDALQKDRLSFEPNRNKFSNSGETVKNLPSEVFNTSMTPGETVNLTDPTTGDVLPYTITKLAQQSTTNPADGPTVSGAYAGASDIWKVQDINTGEVFFVKNASTESAVQSEMASNALGRALGLVGLPVVDRQGDANSTRIITSELGTNMSIPAINSDELVVGANSSPELDTPHLVRMSESDIFKTADIDVSGHVSINNALGILALDAVIQNEDRGSHNIMMVRGNDVPNYPVHQNTSEAWIPIPFDNADGVAVRVAVEQTNHGFQSPYDYLTTSLGESNELGKQFFDRVGPVTFKMLMDKRIDEALANLRSTYGAYMSQAVMDMFSDRLNQMKNYTADTWSEIYG